MKRLNLRDLLGPLLLLTLGFCLVGLVMGLLLSIIRMQGTDSAALPILGTLAAACIPALIALRNAEINHPDAFEKKPEPEPEHRRKHDPDPKSLRAWLIRNEPPVPRWVLIVGVLVEAAAMVAWAAFGGG